ncbi:MAG: FliH/SctL family protein [Bacteroidota bacterium]
MSKIIKSQHFVEAHPCRLDPVDVDAFFVNNQEEEATQNSSFVSEEETAAALEEILETIFPPEENQAMEADEPDVAKPDNEAEESETTEETNDTPEVDLFKINLEAEKLIDQSKQEASVLTQLAREKADNITNTAEKEAFGIIEQARKEAARIKEKAQLHADGIIEKAQQDAGETLNKAKQEAEGIIKQARQEAENLKIEAQRQGSETGYQEGLTKAKQEIEGNLKNSIIILAQAEEERVRRIASSEAELLKLVTGIAEKIIGSELKSDPQQLISIVKEALSRVATAGSITVKINPDALGLLQENLPSLQEVFSEPKAIAIQGDQTILPGDCFIETEHGKVDARVKSQLERIMNEILKVGQINEPG